MTIELSNEEAQNLLALIDTAVRAQGLNAVQAALPILAKVEQAKAQQQPPTT